MTIVELRDRLTDIINENERRGWGNRNSSNVAVRIQVSKRKVEYRAIPHVSSAWMGLGQTTNVFEIDTAETIWTNYKER